MLKVSRLFLALLCGTSLVSRADSAPVFMAGADGTAPGKGKVTVPATPGEKIQLNAGFFESTDGSQEVPDPDGTYDWQLRCGKDASAPCTAATLTESGHGRLVEISRDPVPGLRVVVTHTRADGTQDGRAELELGPAAPEAAGRALRNGGGAELVESHEPESFAEEPHNEERDHHHRRQGGDTYGPIQGGGNEGGGRRGGGRTSVGMGGGGGDGSFGSFDDSGSSYRSRRSRNSSSSGDSYSSSYGGGGSYGSSGSSGASPQFRPNGDGGVSVVSCYNVPVAGGKNKVVCEDEVKVLRVKAKAPVKKLKVVKVVKKAPVKKAPAKKAAQASATKRSSS